MHEEVMPTPPSRLYRSLLLLIRCARIALLFIAGFLALLTLVTSILLGRLDYTATFMIVTGAVALMYHVTAFFENKATDWIQLGLWLLVVFGSSLVYNLYDGDLYRVIRETLGSAIVVILLCVEKIQNVH